MKPPVKRSFAPILAVGLLILSVAFFFLPSRQLVSPAKQQPVAPTQTVAAVTTNLSAGSTITNVMKSPAAAVLANWPGFQERPLPVAYQSPNFEWTLADGKDTNIIRELAHNPLEYDRMVEENSRIFKRELVYLKETAAGVFEQARLTGEPVKQMTLPGVDGQELPFQIVKSEGSDSSRQGQFSGHLAGNNDSLVTLAFADGREAFTVLSPKENIFIVGEPREDGQVIVKAIDPNIYGVGPAEQADDAIKTQPANK
jgi:hypothetical protein